MKDLERLLGILSEARRRVVRIALVLGPLFGFLVTFRLQPVLLRLGPIDLPLAYPVPSLFYNVTAQVFRALVAWTLPPNVDLINYHVGDSVVVQLEIGALLTLILGMPWIVHEVGAFLVPALRHNERELLRRIGLPATALFAIGTSLGLLFLTPLTFRLLFQYVGALGLAPVLGVQDFVTFVLLYSLAFGIVFELPVFVYTLTRLGLVRAAAWRKHWRAAIIGALVFELPVFVYTLTRLGLVRASAWRKHWRAAILGALVFGMVVTPDNSGITMLLVATPMIALYLGGAWFAQRWETARRPIVTAGG